MARRWGVLIAVLAVGMLAGSQGASGATTRTLSFDAAAFVPFTQPNQTTTHASSPPCQSAPTPDPADGEFKGSLLQAAGGMLFPVQLPPGARVTRLRYTIVDQDSAADSFVYLLRKSLAAGITKDAGYLVMATTHSSGNLPDKTRQFNDTTINGAVADPNDFAYYLEIVNCDITLEPIGVQVTMAT
ncbi:MAG: hypothetical protein ACJ77A_06725 [Actinomycetota bacterium]